VRVVRGSPTQEHGDLYAITAKNDFGFISAWRSAPIGEVGRPYTETENLQRSDSLLAKLRLLGHRVIAIKGDVLVVDGDSSIRDLNGIIFVVVDVQKRGGLREALLKLGREFEQDRVVYYANGRSGAAIIIEHHSINENRADNLASEHGIALDPAEAFERNVVGRPFRFENPLKWRSFGVCKYPTELRGPFLLSEKHWSELSVCTACSFWDTELNPMLPR
jgi:hypothetical protein